MGRVKITPQTKIFKNYAKKLKLAPKARTWQELSKTKRKNLFLSLFLMMSALFRQKISKDGQILGKFQKFIKNYSDIIYE